MDLDLAELRGQIAIDRFSPACRKALTKIKLDRQLPRGRWRQALNVLVEFLSI